ncbi:MAG: SDR family NAD(P)-dependent oxidoreductase [Myxococcota bacterium]|nr:SDR family NAD(P)-dependent oxidoreductase [Myxococcota bacterium]
MHILITGASSGIGEALTRHFGSDPVHQITLVARRLENLEALASELSAPAYPMRADLSLPDSAEKVVANATQRFGDVDLLINNAGANHLGEPGGFDVAVAEKLFALNVFSPMRLVEAVLPAMRRRQHGTIVNIASIAAANAPGMMTHYAATKAALARYSEGLATQLEEEGIKVLTVYPGPVKTPMEDLVRDQLGGDLGMGDRLPSGRADELAIKIEQAIKRSKRRLVYPGFYASALWLPLLGQRLTDEFSPRLKTS